MLAADHFLTRGFTNFCFYSDADNWSYEERGQGFVKALADSGHNCTWLRWLESPTYATGKQEWKRKRKWLATQMKQAAKPLAVFAANDQQALDVLESCESAGHQNPGGSGHCRRGKLSARARMPCARRFPAWTPIWKCWVIAARNCWTI